VKGDAILGESPGAGEIDRLRARLDGANRRIGELELELEMIRSEIASFRLSPAWRLAKRLHRLWWWRRNWRLLG
jgi:hypothetical protein